MAAPAYMDLKTNAQWKEYLQNLVKTNDKALLRSVLVIYDRQTPDERISGQSTEDNNTGFTKWDAEQLTTIARKIKTKQPLTERELAICRNKMVKYWKQLMEVSKLTVAKRLEEEYNKAEAERMEQFKTVNDAMTQCMEHGIACEYGICDECIVNQGIQIHL